MLTEISKRMYAIYIGRNWYTCVTNFGLRRSERNECSGYFKTLSI